MSIVFKVIPICTCLKNSYKKHSNWFLTYVISKFFIAFSKRTRLPKCKHRVLMEKRGVRCKGFRFCHTKVQDVKLVPIVTLRLGYHCGKFHKNSFKFLDFIKIF